MMILTKEETAAINTLKRLAKKWPKSLWLYSASGTLWVMRHDENGEKAMNHLSGFDGDAAITSIDIPNDGGDW